MKNRWTATIISLVVAFMVTILSPRSARALESCANTPDGQVRTVKTLSDGQTVVEIGKNAGVYQVIRRYGADYEAATGKPLTWAVIHAANPDKVFPACGSRYIRLADTAIWDACPEDKQTIGLMACESGRITIPIITLETYAAKEARHLVLEMNDKRIEWHQARITALGGQVATPAPKPAVAPSAPVVHAPLAETQKDKRIAELEATIVTKDARISTLSGDVDRLGSRPSMPMAFLFALAMSMTIGLAGYAVAVKKRPVQSSALEEANAPLKREVERLQGLLTKTRREREAYKAQAAKGQTVMVRDSNVVIQQGTSPQPAPNVPSASQDPSNDEIRNAVAAFEAQLLRVPRDQRPALMDRIRVLERDLHVGLDPVPAPMAVRHPTVRGLGDLASQPRAARPPLDSSQRATLPEVNLGVGAETLLAKEGEITRLTLELLDLRRALSVKTHRSQLVKQAFRKATREKRDALKIMNSNIGTWEELVDERNAAFRERDDLRREVIAIQARSVSRETFDALRGDYGTSSDALARANARIAEQDALLHDVQVQDLDRARLGTFEDFLERFQLFVFNRSQKVDDNDGLDELARCFEALGNPPDVLRQAFAAESPVDLSHPSLRIPHRLPSINMEDEETQVMNGSSGPSSQTPAYGSVPDAIRSQSNGASSADIELLQLEQRFADRLQGLVRIRGIISARKKEPLRLTRRLHSLVSALLDTDAVVDQEVVSRLGDDVCEYFAKPRNLLGQMMELNTFPLNLPKLTLPPAALPPAAAGA